jgi:hypothetical protein
MQTFYHGLTTTTCETMDAAAGGAFLSLNLKDATTLVATKAGMKNVLRLIREVEVCINSRR